MERIIPTMVIVMILVCTIAITDRIEHCYTRENCTVVERTVQGVKIEDKEGRTWICEGIYEFDLGTKVDARMHDNFTSNCVEDDIVKSLEISGL